MVLTIANNLKTAFLAALQRSATPQQKELVEQAASLTAQDNVEPACAFIQKTAVEKSISEIDKRLATEFDLRKHARNEGRRYYDPSVFTYQVFSYKIYYCLCSFTYHNTFLPRPSGCQNLSD